MTRILATALLAIGISGPDSCVSRERVEACQAACAEHGGYSWVIAAESSADCICADWAFVEIGGEDA